MGVCNVCRGHGLVREFYIEIDWYKTRRKNNGKFYYIDTWQEEPCPKCQIIRSDDAYL